MKKTKLPSPWLIWGIGAMFVLYQFMLQGSISVMIPQLMQDFSTDVVGVSFLSASFMIPYLLLQIPSGLLVDKIGPRKLIIYGFILCAIACFVFSRSQMFSTAVASRLIMGIVTAPGLVCAMYLASQWFPPKRFAMLAGLTELAGMFGGAMGAEGLAFAVERFGWRTTLLFCAVAGAILMDLALFYVKERETKNNEKPDEESVWHKFKLVISIPQIWINGIYAGFLFAIVSGFAAFWCIPYMQKLYHVNLATAGGIAAMLFIGAGVGSPILGWLSDFIGRRKPVMIVGNIIALVLLLIAFYLPGVPLQLMFVLMFFLGFFSSVYMIPYAIVREITPPDICGTALGMVNMLAILFGAPILQPLIGWLLMFFYDGSAGAGTDIFTLQTYQFALALFPLCFLMAMVLVFFIRETNCQEQTVKPTYIPS